MFNLIESMDIANGIFLNQYSPTGKQVINTLLELESTFNDNKVEKLETTRRAMQTNGGLHENYTRKKIRPSFTKSNLKSYFKRLNNPSSKSLSLEVMTDILFNNKVMPTLPTSRGFYPAEVNNEVAPGGANIDRIKANKLGKNKYTRVFFGPNDKIITRFFDKIYEKELDDMSSSIGMASVNFDAVDRANNKEKIDENYVFHLLNRYILYLSQDNKKLTEKHPYDDSDSMMVKAYKARDIPIFFNASFGSGYEDKLGLKVTMGAELSIETDDCRGLKNIIRAPGKIQPMEDMIPFEAAKRKNVPDVPVVIHDIIYRTGASFPNGQGIGVTYLSENKEIRDKEGAVILLWHNVLDFKGRSIMAPIAMNVLPEAVVSEYSDNFGNYQALAFNLMVEVHEESHFVAGQLEDEVLRANLGDLYNTMNEGKAETGSVFFFEHKIENPFPGLGLEQSVEFTRQTYFAEMIRHIRFGEESPYGLSAMLRLNQFVSRGAITITDDLKIEVDIEKALEVNADAYNTHIDIMHGGNYDLAKEYFDKFEIKKGSILNKQLIAIEKQLQKADIPRDITMNYQV